MNCARQAITRISQRLLASGLLFSGVVTSGALSLPGAANSVAGAVVLI